MPREVLYPHKRLLQLDDELKQAVADYRFAHRHATEAEAIRELLRIGLKHAGRRKEK
jgi:plasmid stability protein